MLKFATFLGALAMAMLALTTDVFSDEMATDETATASTQPQQSAEAAQRPAFDQLDQNHDGKISAAEAKGSWLSQSFAKADSDQDGFVSRDEYEHAVS